MVKLEEYMLCLFYFYGDKFGVIVKEVVIMKFFMLKKIDNYLIFNNVWFFRFFKNVFCLCYNCRFLIKGEKLIFV